MLVQERDDRKHFARAAEAFGVDVELYVARGMPHGYLNMTPIVPETAASIQCLAAFVRVPPAPTSGG